jgi:hemoglobin
MTMQAQTITLTPYDQFGGEAGIRKLVDRFYDLMDELPEAYAVRKIHPDDLSGSRDKLFMYLSGWLGGPQLYTEKFGHPRLRSRHMPYSIGREVSDQWLMCMQMAMDEQVPSGALRDQIWEAIVKLADHMQNQPN